MTAPGDVSAWVERAEEDYTLARSAWRRKTPLIYGTTFHAQQCAEKYLKALLVLAGQAFPRTHDLGALYLLCEQNGIRLPIDQDTLERLAAYAVQVRYPGTLPELDEAREALEIAQTVRQFAKNSLRKRAGQE